MAVSTSAGTEQVRALIVALGSLSPAVDDGDRIERVRLFEELKAVAAAAQATEARDFDASQRAQQAIDGVPAARQGRGIAAQIALARRISPWSAQRYLGWAKILPDELPETFALLKAGRITEWRATLVARETVWLTPPDRAQVDAELAPRLEQWGDKRIEAETRRVAYRLDPHGFVQRSNNAVNDRRVSIRPAPETMARLSALLPAAQAIAAYAALCRAADTTTAAGDERGRGQIMADTFVERLTGQATADAVPVEVAVLIPADTLLDNDDEPAELLGYGPVPAGIARDLALSSNGTTATDADAARRRIRRLFTSPSSGQLITMDTQARLFTANERRFIRYRDHDTCRTPWCDAKMRHTDHVTAHADGGATSTSNGQGLCEACNYARQAARWRGLVIADTVTITTPTGHRYSSRPPDPPGTAPPDAEVEPRLIALRQRGRLAA